MSKRLTRGWLVRAGIASAVGAAAILAAVTMGGGGTVTQAAAPQLTWTAVGGGNQTVLGSAFAVNLNVVNNTGVTWGGYQLDLKYDSSKLVVVSTTAGGLAGCSGPNWANPTNVGPTAPPTPPNKVVQTGCAFQSTTAQSPPPSEIIMFQCVGKTAAPTVIHFVTILEDGTSGSTFFDATAVNLETATVDTTVNCQLPITKSHAGGPTLAAGSTVTYTVHVGNPTAFSIGGLVVEDSVPPVLTGVALVNSTNGALDNCTVLGNLVKCATATATPDPTGFNVVFTGNIPLSAAGTTICNSAKLDPPSGPVSNSDCFNVAPSALVVTKTVGPGPFKSGDTIVWTITVNSPGGSSATGVVVTDTVTDGFVITSSTGTIQCPANPTTPLSATWNCGTMGAGVQTLTITGTVNTPNPADSTCNNEVKATSTNGPPSNLATASVACLSKNVRMVKDTNGNLNETIERVNLWLCKAVTCTGQGMGQLTISEWVLNVSGDPQGVGAFEFQLKYDNHIFDVLVCEGSAPLVAGACAPVVVGSPLHWLYSTGRIPGATGIGGCAATVITENDIRFGCVSKNPTTGATGCLGPDNVTNVPTAQCGPKTDGIAATIHLTPKADLGNRMRPGNDNGAIRTILDEGCEVADIWGHPLSAALGAPIPGVAANGYDALGREIPLPGILPGGQVVDCADMTITVRFLEGDMNADCIVDVTDDQIEASHFGAFFGTLLYQPWFDLEPALMDGDVDIKDLQKVFGRNGSTCTTPIPPQPPLPDPDP